MREETCSPLLREVDRIGTECEKWDALEEIFGRPDLISMWVADMDFAAPQPVLDALSARIAHGAFGYHRTPEGWKQAIVDWELARHRNVVEPSWIRYVPGVVPALFWLASLLTEPGDACLIQTPVYYPFASAVEKTGRSLVTHDLVNANGQYRIDFDGLEQCILENRVRLFILCSPHNPVGRVWTREELIRIRDICSRHHVFVLADEIHRDLVIGEAPFVPYAAVAEDPGTFITLASASKTFNLASLNNAFLLIPDPAMRERYDAAIRQSNPGGGNHLGYVATEAALRHGAPWLEALLAQVRHNADMLRERLSLEVPEIVLSPLQGTYLQWADMRGLLPAGELTSFMRDVCRVAVNYGEWFGKAGTGFVRLNLATPLWRVEAVADRIAAGAAQIRAAGGKR